MLRDGELCVSILKVRTNENVRTEMKRNEEGKDASNTVDHKGNKSPESSQTSCRVFA